MEVEITPEIEKEIYSIIDKKFKSMESELSGVVGYSVNWDRYIVYDRDLERYVVKVNVEITAKLYEISEVCTHYTYEDVIEYYDLDIPGEILESVDNLEDLIEYADKYYSECVENLLDELNNEYALNTRIEFENEYVKITSYSIPCDGDYCIVGGGLDITIKSIDSCTVAKSLEIVEKVLMLFRYY